MIAEKKKAKNETAEELTTRLDKLENFVIDRMYDMDRRQYHTYLKMILTGVIATVVYTMALISIAVAVWIK